MNCFAKFTEKHYAKVSFLISLQLGLKKENPAEVFSCEFSEMFQSSFLFRIFPHSDCILRDLPVFTPNAGKYGPEKLRIRKFFYAVVQFSKLYESRNISDILRKSLVSCEHRIKVYLRHCQTFMMEFFCENSQWLKAINYFCEKDRS